MKNQIYFRSLAILIFSLALAAFAVRAQTTEFTYQGKISDTAGTAANYDFEFKLFSVTSGGTALGTTQTKLNVPMSNGAFTVQLNFGAQFDGSARYLEIAVRPAGSGAAFTVLSPRQPITSAPYSVRAATATNSTQLGGVAANQFVQTTDSRLSDNRNPLPNSSFYIRNSTTPQTASLSITGTANFGGAGNFDGGLSVATQGGGFFVGGNSTLQGNLTVNGTLTANLPAGDSNYIQNRTSQQSTTNFNISGNGTIGGTLTATTVNGNIFSGAIFNSTVYRIGDQNVLSSFGTRNIFAGASSGNAGTDNSFFGYNAGNANTATGTDNSFFGSDAGGSNTSGYSNSFFGSDTGDSNTTGINNSFFGRSAGTANTTASDNSFFGAYSGQANSTGNLNSFFGRSAGLANTTAGENSFFGAFAGQANTTGDDNSFFGAGAGFVNTTGLDNSYFGRGAGQASNGSQNAFFGGTAGGDNTTGSSNSFFGRAAGGLTTTGNFNVFVGKLAGSTNTTGSNNTVIGANADVRNPNFIYATAIGADSEVTASNTIQLGRTSGLDDVRVSGRLFVGSLFPGGSQFLCYDNTFDILSDCSSSLRYKTNVETFTAGLSVVRRLRPITFNWKVSGTNDVGFGAEEVAEIETLLTTRNEQGEIEGVKYAQVTTVLVNAVNEQQAQIEEQQKRIDEQNLIIKQQAKQLSGQETRFQRQQAELEDLKSLICSQNQAAPVCRKKVEEKK